MTSFPFDIVGFDLDGTLLDSHRDLAGAVNHALSLAGRAPLPDDAVRDLIGGGTRAMLHKALEVTGGPLPEEQMPALYEALMVWYEAHMTDLSRFYPGAEAMLDDLAARGVKLAVVTNKLERLATKILDDLGQRHRFFTVIGGDTLGPGRSKPAPDLLDLMIERAGGGKAAYVGDSSFDTGAAKAAGLPCVVVSFGFNDGDPAALGGTAVIDGFEELAPVLSKL
ncbi:HAD-IA family hydrolase [Novosphingobium sp. 9]|uniref:HAD-IA family hydrolase n=1 Tax=Novosphingobium sp. 9 TaxID=2025349 RepID=UPI0021B5395E|nr:HAD-IA family hydrolase [Novosphingobium sp. 9]